MTPDASPRSSRTQLVVLVLGLVTSAMANTVMFTVLGPVAREIGLSEIQVGFIVAATGVTFLFSSPWWGRHSDRIGRKRVYLIGLTAYGLGSAAFAGLLDLGLQGVLTGAAAFWALLRFRAGIYAVLGGGAQPAASAWVADSTEGAQRVSGMALVGSAFAMGSILGPAMGGLLSTFGVLVPLYVISLLSMVAVAVAARVVREPAAHIRRDAQVRTPLSVTDPRIRYLLLTSAFIFITIGSTQQVAAFYVQDLTGSDTARTMQLVSLAMIALAVGILVAQGGVVQWLKPSPRRLLMAGIPIALAGFVQLAISNAFLQVVVGYAAIGFGYGLANPAVSAAVSLAVDEHVQGAAAGFVSASYSAGFVVGPLLGTMLYALGPQWTFSVSALLAAAAFVLAVFATRHLPERAP